RDQSPAWHPAGSTPELLLPQSRTCGGHGLRHAHPYGARHRAPAHPTFRMRVAIVFDARADSDAAAPDVAGVLEAVTAVAAALESLGHECIRIGASRCSGWTRALEASGVDVVFNLCEGLDGDAALEADAARAMAAPGVPLTGAE